MSAKYLPHFVDVVIFDMTSREEPFVFQIGRQQMIEGWEKGLLDMCVGEKRKLVVPSDMVRPPPLVDPRWDTIDQHTLTIFISSHAYHAELQHRHTVKLEGLVPRKAESIRVQHLCTRLSY